MRHANRYYHLTYKCSRWGDMVAHLVGYRTSNSQVADSSPGWAPPCSGLGQATYICVPQSPSSTSQGAVMLFGWEGNSGPARK